MGRLRLARGAHAERWTARARKASEMVGQAVGHSAAIPFFFFFNFVFYLF